MLDPLLHRSVVLKLDGDSYRLRDHHARNQNQRTAVHTATAAVVDTSQFVGLVNWMRGVIETRKCCFDPAEPERTSHEQYNPLRTVERLRRHRRCEQRFFADGDDVVVITQITAGGESGLQADVLTYRNGKLVKAQSIADTALQERVYGKK